MLCRIGASEVKRVKIQLYHDASLKRLDVAHVQQGITRFYLPLTHEPPAFTPQRQGVTTLWLVLIAPTHEGMARLS